MASESYRLSENRGGCQQQQDSNFGAERNYDQEGKHDDAIHIMEVGMMLNRMQLESLESDERLRRNRRPKLTQNNSYRQLTAVNDGKPCLSHNYTINMTSNQKAHKR